MIPVPVPVISFEGRPHDNNSAKKLDDGKNENNDNRWNPAVISSGGGRHDDNNTKKTKDERNENKFRGKKKDLHSILHAGGGLQNIDNFYMHIPKTAGNSARNRMNELLLIKDGNGLCPKKRGLVCDHGRDSYLQYREWDGIYVRPTGNCKGLQTKCIMHMAESEYPLGMQTHVYTFVRPPHEHVLSQYFHCKESNDGNENRKEVIPSLDKWLNSWVSQMESGVPPRPQHRYPTLPLSPKTRKIEEKKRKMRDAETLKGIDRGRRRVRSLFKCYNPINMQSSFFQFNETLSPEESKIDLKQRFDVIGLTTQFDKSACLIIIHLIGEVPSECDCTSKRRLRRIIPSMTHGGITHGVKHHGSLFQTTESQRHAISNLTQIDKNIFQYAEELFEQNVIRTEEKYSFKMCDTWIN